jgi:flagellar biosynthesis protein FlhF
MKVVKFEAPTMRDALAKVKSTLGDQAVVVSARQVPRGLLGTAYEVAVAIDGDDDEDAPPRRRRGARSYADTDDAPAAAAPPPPAPAPERDVDALVAPLRSELRTLRAMVRAAGEPRGTADLRRELGSLRTMLEALQARTQAADAPARAPRVDRDAPTATTGLPADDVPATAAGGRLDRAPGSPPPAPLCQRSEAAVIMLVGPTGVGKTTTIAKLAARAALVEGRSVAIVTLDSYRVGGVSQIRTFADLIGVPLHVTDDAAALPDLLAQLAEHDLVLVDTAGRSPRDAHAFAELADVLATLPEVEVHLVASADATGRRLDELARRYRGLRPRRLLITKLDDADEVPELLAAPARLGLPLTWVTTGQAVPEDLEEITPARVLELAAAGFAASANRGRTVRPAA